MRIKNRQKTEQKLSWHIPQNIPKNLFKYGEERSIASDCTQEEKINSEGSTETATAFGGFTW